MNPSRLSLALPLALAGLAGCSSDAPGEQTGETSEAYTKVCPTDVVEGVDVYDGQGTIMWAQVKAAGRDFAIIKASQGDYNSQTKFAANWAGAKAAGVLRSPYHFFDPTIDGVTQANHFLSIVTAAGGLQPGDLPPMLDIECPTSSTQASASANCEYTGNSGWVATATMVKRVFDFLATVEQATGKKAIIYSYPSWFADVGLTDARLAQYPLFIATLSTCASVPLPWTTTVFWQYSFTGTVAGIPGQVDMDRFVGTKAQLIAFANGPATDAGPDGATDAANDAEPSDARAEAATPFDAAIDGAATSATNTDDGGCSCRAAGRTPGAPASAGVALATLAILVRLARRSRRRALFRTKIRDA